MYLFTRCLKKQALQGWNVREQTQKGTTTEWRISFSQGWNSSPALYEDAGKSSWAPNLTKTFLELGNCMKFEWSAPEGQYVKAELKARAEEFLNACILSLSFAYLWNWVWWTGKHLKHSLLYIVISDQKWSHFPRKSQCTKGDLLKQKQKDWNLKHSCFPNASIVTVFYQHVPPLVKRIFHGNGLLIQKHGIVSILLHLLSISNGSKHLDITRKMRLNHTCSPGRLSDEGIWEGKISLAVLLPALSALPCVKHNPDRL